LHASSFFVLFILGDFFLVAAEVGFCNSIFCVNSCDGLSSTF
jgi:hypothetical protein